MANPLIINMTADVKANRLSVSVTRDRTDGLTGLTTPEVREVTGPLNTLGGLAALRTNLVTWVKAQSGFVGTVDVSP